MRFENGLTDASLVKMLARHETAGGKPYVAKLPGDALASLVRELQAARATIRAAAQSREHVDHWESDR